MSRSSRRLKVVLAPMCLMLAAIVFAGPAAGETVHFQKESLHAYEGQLHHREVHAATFHTGTGTGHLHISLNNGKHMTVAYAATRQGALVAQARALGARVQVATVKVKPATAVHHKLRYIAGGILIVVILIVLVVLLIGRRRVIAEEGRTPPSESAP